MYKEKNCARFLDLRLVDLNLNCSRLACGKSKMLFILATSQSSTFNFDKCEVTAGSNLGASSVFT